MRPIGWPLEMDYGSYWNWPIFAFCHRGDALVSLLVVVLVEREQKEASDARGLKNQRIGLVCHSLAKDDQKGSVSIEIHVCVMLCIASSLA
jgi:hypothetical protein